MMIQGSHHTTCLPSPPSGGDDDSCQQDYRDCDCVSNNTHIHHYPTTRSQHGILNPFFRFIHRFSERRRELQSCRVADDLRRRDWKTNGCDKKYSSSSSSEKSYHHPNKSFLISYHQEERFS